MSDPVHAVFELSNLISSLVRSGEPWVEFLRVESMSAGLYRLPAGAIDEQAPHGQDEVYSILSGRALLQVGAEDVEVAGGSVVFVPAHMVHRFHDISEDLTALVMFAPAEQEQD